MKELHNTNRSVNKVQIIKIIIQAASFVFAPGVFILLFSAIGDIYKAAISGTFVLSEHGWQIAMLAAVFGITAVWGRFFCGFLCSFGTIQDLMWFFGKKIPVKPVISEKADRVLKFVKYGVLAFVVIGVWTFSVTGDTLWSPWTVFGMYTGFFKGFPAAGYLVSIGGVIMLATIVGSLFIERFFCKYLCPLGALFTLASRFRLFRIKKPVSACGSCTLCTKKCSMSIPLYKQEKVTSGECINCMKCSAVCFKENARYETIPAVSGTMATMAVAGVTFAGTVPLAGCNTGADTQQTINAVTETTAEATETTLAAGKYKDGKYSGSAAGFRGQVNVTVTVENGNITDITVDSHDDDREFFDKAEDKVIAAIIKSQDTEVDAVSGATFSSKGIMNAVANALDSGVLAQAAETGESKEPETTTMVKETFTEKETETTTETVKETTAETTTAGATEAPAVTGKFADGVYTGSGSGFRGTTQVKVTVEGGEIRDITVTSYQDDRGYFDRAEDSVIADIIDSQDIDVDAVSGATFSSNSIIEAVADALGLEYTNPNSSLPKGRGGR